MARPTGKVNVITDAAVKAEEVVEEVQQEEKIVVTPVVKTADVLIVPNQTFFATFGDKRYQFVEGKEMRVSPDIKARLAQQGALKVL